ncbi:MAG: hypothetical protein DI562_03505 [Stenotrophomonas acidaminiphila]|uniref:Polyketide cyclase/dehydrase and lipid transport n=1 Tax=Stenotrophomonas acidaminiphila TaxID=128780 RepID=A0A0S1AZN4_9GAMM|nr:SRPBCC family protein [Stenotrophomonas acidaminiphila]ALJ28277.1 polyketide cyclase/dehydrase and lipid transport [Stenotrophomonas acidaminiphila]PZQ32484.1 MAG: hypothetical protein DI562_03505 [Stenotrophomonas acidaminiphila]
MKWWMLTGGLIGVLLLTGLAVYLVGRSLPAEHIAEGGREIGATVDMVAQRVWGVETQPQWRRRIARVEVSEREPGRVRYTEYVGRDAITFELVEQEGGRRFESRIVSTDLPFGGRWLIALDPIGEQRTRVSIREEGVVHSPMFRALGRYVFGHTATMEAYLNDLARSFEGTDHGA